MPTETHTQRLARMDRQAAAARRHRSQRLEAARARHDALERRDAAAEQQLVVDLAPLATLLGRFLWAVVAAAEGAWRAAHPQEAAVADARTRREYRRALAWEREADGWGA